VPSIYSHSEQLINHEHCLAVGRLDKQHDGWYLMMIRLDFIKKRAFLVDWKLIYKEDNEKQYMHKIIGDYPRYSIIQYDDITHRRAYLICTVSKLGDISVEGEWQPISMEYRDLCGLKFKEDVITFIGANNAQKFFLQFDTLTRKFREPMPINGVSLIISLVNSTNLQYDFNQVKCFNEHLHYLHLENVSNTLYIALSAFNPSTQTWLPIINTKDASNNRNNDYIFRINNNGVASVIIDRALYRFPLV
jgi:hypothetical protein